MRQGRGEGGLGRVKLRDFLTPNPHCVAKDTGNIAAPPFTSPAIIAPPPTHTHRARGEGTEFHAPLTEIKQKVHPLPWNAIVATSLKSVKEAEENGGGRGTKQEDNPKVLFPAMPIC